MDLQKTLIKFFLFIICLLSTGSISALEVVGVKPDINKETASSAQVETSNNAHLITAPVVPKKKKRFFKKLRERVVKNKLANLLHLFQFDSLKCDIIYLENGEEIEARIIKINPGATVYKPCDQPNEAKQTLLNYKIRQIEYADGNLVKFDNHESKDWKKREQRPQRKNVWLIGFLLGVFLGLLGILIAYAIYDDELMARKEAISGAIIGFLATFILALYIISKL